MSRQELLEAAFYGWWFLFNGWIQYMEIDFLCEVTHRPGHRFIPLWIVLNEMLIVVKFFMGFSCGFFLHLLFLLSFSVGLLKIPWNVAAAPLVIIGTLYTFTEGYSAIGMYWISRNLESRWQGTVLQIVLSVLLSTGYFGILKLVRSRYSAALQWPVSSYLYVLLFPCGFIVALMRAGLKLDSKELERYFSAVGMDTSIASFLILSGAMAIFLMMIKIFCVIVDQAQREKNMMILKVQLEGQRTYVEESQKRNREYSKFQHDIDNHLLVLAGLIRNGEYKRAEEYISKFHTRSQELTDLASTGSKVLDILLKEKVSHGMREGIRMNCRVRIPADFLFDEMDLSIIFANVLDNAIHECTTNPCEGNEISIYTKTRGRFLVIEAVNHWRPRPMEEGIGLANIRNVAQKYQGMVEICSTDGMFRISVLLCSPGKDEKKERHF